MAYTIAGTGHRPPRLGLDYSTESNRRLTNFVMRQLNDLEVPSHLTIISGMAQGYDSALAHAAHLLGIPYVCAVPFEGHESKWPPDAQKRYRALLGHAEEVHIVTKGGYSKRAFAVRDEFMVDSADTVLALWDGAPKGGTYITVKYAEQKRVQVVNLWDQWQSQ